MQRAAATVSRTLTDEGLMSQEYFEAAEAGASQSPCSRPSPDWFPLPGRFSHPKARGT
jgi:hypothetical protein